jgi:uncharacterized membrane protein
MLDDWQTWAAPVVVGVVLLAFSYRWWRRLRRKAAAPCGSGCGCAGKNPLAKQR